MRASQLSRINFALELSRSVELIGRKVNVLAMWKWGEENGGWIKGGYKIDDISASVIHNTFIPFVSLHFRLVDSARARIHARTHTKYFHERTQLRYHLEGYSISTLKFSNVPLLFWRDTTTSRSDNGLLHVEKTSKKFSLRRKTNLPLWSINKDNENSLTYFYY